MSLIMSHFSSTASCKLYRATFKVDDCSISQFLAMWHASKNLQYPSKSLAIVRINGLDYVGHMNAINVNNLFQHFKCDT